jgi:hypothetical protein
MMEIFVIQAIKAVAACRRRPQQPGMLRLVFREDDHLTRCRSGAGRPGDGGQQVFGRGVVDLLRGIDPEAVDVELPDPVRDVAQHEFADRTRAVPVEVQGLTPLIRVSARAIVRCVPRQHVAARAQVVVDDVEHHAEVQGVCRIDERLQVGRCPVCVHRREPVHAVVPPPVLPGKLRDGHHLDGRDAQIAEAGQHRCGGPPGALACVRAHVHLVEHLLRKGQAPPVVVTP